MPIQNQNPLLSKALSLPSDPGVYLMYNRQNVVIYVGKAKNLKNRVCQYFRSGSDHTPKVAKMVSLVDHFEYVVCGSEFGHWYWKPL
jgi:excinuclease ABC subunit C